MTDGLGSAGNAAAATLPPDDRSLTAERARGIALSHRDWVLADSARSELVKYSGAPERTLQPVSI